MSLTISNLLSKHNIRQIHISEAIINHKNTYLKEINLDEFEYVDKNVNTLFWGMYRNIDLELIKQHEGKKWIYWHDNDCNPDHANRVLNVTNILKDDIQNHYCTTKKTKNYLSFYNINPTNLSEIKIENTDENVYHDEIYMILANNLEKYKTKYKLLQLILKKFDKKYIIIQAGSTETFYKNNILHLEFEECWENIPKKIYHGLEYIYNNTVHTHVYKLDDDFHIKKYNKSDSIFKNDYYGNYIIRDMDPKYHFGKCKNEDLNKKLYDGEFLCEYAAGGYGYILSRRAMSILIKNKSYFYKELYEDKAVGDILFKNNIVVNDEDFDELSRIIKKKDIKK